MRFTRQSTKVTRNVLQAGTDPRGRTYYWLHEQQIIDGMDPDTDHAAIFDGAFPSRRSSSTIRIRVR